MSIASTEDKVQRRLEVKARSTLIMVIPNEHQLKFNSIKDAKSLLEAIKKRFGGNDATKKTQRNLLKYQYENFTASSFESLDQTFDRLQKLINEPEVKEVSSSSTNTQNMAFVSSSSNNNINSSNEAVKTAFGVTTAGTEMAMLTMRARRFLKNTGRKLNLNRNETIAFDKTKVECYNFHKRGHFARECRALRAQDNRHMESTKRNVLVETINSSALVSCDGLGGYDWSDQVKEGTNNALMAYSTSSSNSEILNKLIDSQIMDNCKKGLGYNTVSPPHTVETLNAKTSKEVPKVVKKDNGAPIIENWKSDDENESLPPPKIEIKQSNLVLLRPKAILNAVKGYKGNPQMDLQEKGVIDSGCSRVPRKNNMYSVDLKNIILKEGLTCLFAKATSNESRLWHRRLEHLNFKIMNKLVKGNLCFQDAGFKPSNDVGKKVNEVPRQKNECKDQEEKGSVNSTNRVNAASNEVNAVGRKSSIELPNDPDMPEWEDITYLKTQMKIAIGSKWVFKNKLDERGIMIKNKARLVAQGHTQEEGIDYDEVFLPVVRIEAIRLFLAYASFKDFVVYQMDVKSDFVYEKIEEEVYLCQPPGFENPEFPDKVYKVEKALYGLHQAPRAIGVNAGDSKLLLLGITSAELLLLDRRFSSKETPLFLTMVGPNQVQMGKGSAQPTYTQYTPAFDMPPPKPKKTKKPKQTKRKTTKVPQPSESIDIAADEAVYTEGVIVWCQDTMRDTSAHTRYEGVSKMSSDPLLAGKVLDLEDELKRTKTAQQTKIYGLERRVKKLEKKHMSRTHKLKRLYKVGVTARVISSSDDEAFDKEDTSKHGRIDEIDADEDIALVSTHDDVVQNKGIEDVGEEEVVEVVTTAKMLIDAAQVTTTIADISVSAAAETIVTTALNITVESTKKNVKFTQVQDKSKGKTKLIEEPEMPKKRKHQIRADKELAEKLLAEMDAKIDKENRIARERSQKEQEANDALINTWDDIQAKIDADA
uniref:Retrovirus-related Pol polyprotein from transposon TNT 1-94 n=1 Tax=Tanacetum cinerariifolium TaxID=118510 RepID=A0A6L2KR77_TANCI|nr:retrovirus-related Pol polyprotein from transposon TNT 1-94 [Tanacetum cinerariifolium]